MPLLAIARKAHDRYALQQLALNVHVKHSDLTLSPKQKLPFAPLVHKVSINAKGTACFRQIHSHAFLAMAKSGTYQKRKDK